MEIIPMYFMGEGEVSPYARTRLRATPSTGGQPPVTPPQYPTACPGAPPALLTAASRFAAWLKTPHPPTARGLRHRRNRTAASRYRGLAPLRAKRTAFCRSLRRPTGGKGGMDAVVSGRRRPGSPKQDVEGWRAGPPRHPAAVRCAAGAPDSKPQSGLSPQGPELLPSNFLWSFAW
jgi:hypothetical protein